MNPKEIRRKLPRGSLSNRGVGSSIAPFDSNESNQEE